MNKNIDPKFKELCTAYVLRALSGDEEKEFLSMLENAGPDEREFYYKMTETASALSAGVSKAVPAPHIKEKILKEINQEHSERSRDQANILNMRRFRFAVAASFVFIFMSLGLLYYSQNLRQEIGQKEQLITQQETRIQSLNSELERKEELLAILESREVDLVVMSGQQVNPQGYGKVVWDKDNGQALLQIANLPLITDQNDYQLWFIKDGQPISAGIFGVKDPSRDNFFKIENLKDSADQGAFAITLEPGGGSPQPTGDMYLLGELGS
ncbi:anti-sigma factor domain-containing protein [Balneola sp. MJW-20]|uniref:anti-sigma factor n=1 Tax=Gracilimonas aurantiaca TaxID=3234185 RepID=UPI0034673B5C